MNHCYRAVLLLLICLFTKTAMAQYCPPNIGFEDGTLNGWEIKYGSIRNGALNLNSASTGPNGRYTLLYNTSPQALDPYGGFPVNCPNGSGYTLMLGNSTTGAEAEALSYTLNIPATENHYTLTYYYAVVLQNPNHATVEQPAFTAVIEDLTPGVGNGQTVYKSALDCGIHTFTAQSGQLGFHDIGTGSNVIQYKEWSPVNVSLIGYAGHKLKITFMTNDCTRGGHFGYAYLDFEENCKSPITGNNYCVGTSEVTLTAPPGYQSYAWYPKNKFKDTLSNTYSLHVTPPVDGTEYALIVTPYPNLGCVDTLYTTLHAINEVFDLKVTQNTVMGCKSTGVNLEADSITAGSIPAKMKKEYYLDPDGQNYLPDPKRVTADGTYYIRGSNDYGCTDIKPVTVKLFDGPPVTVRVVPAVCKPATIDLTSYVTTAPDATLYYYSDFTLTKKVPNPAAIDKSGTYYVQSVSATVPCGTVVPVALVVSDLPVANPLTLIGCPPQSLFTPINAGNPDNAGTVAYEFYADAALKQRIADPTKITTSGIYYYRGINGYNCVGNVSTITATLYREPLFDVTDPAPVVFPETVNLVNTHVPLVNAEFTYWKDAKCTIPLENYDAVGASGTYYIKATNPAGCFIIQPVKVLVNAPPEADLVATNTFTPNGDGINDQFMPTTKGVLRVNYLKIFNRHGGLVFETKELLNRWNGTSNGQPSPSGSYYWVFSCYDVYRKQAYTRSGQLTLVR